MRDSVGQLWSILSLRVGIEEFCVHVGVLELDSGQKTHLLYLVVGAMTTIDILHLSSLSLEGSYIYLTQ